MITWQRTVFALLVLGLVGCVPLVLETQSRHFAANEYSYPLPDGLYVIEGQGRSSIRWVAQADHVTATIFEDGRETNTMIGGFIALGTPGHFIFQVTDATENGKPVSKASDESTYIPARVSSGAYRQQRPDDLVRRSRQVRCRLFPPAARSWVPPGRSHLEGSEMPDQGAIDGLLPGPGAPAGAERVEMDEHAADRQFMKEGVG